MNVCPTSAIRIRHGKASINEAACTDCGMCLKSCPRHAIIVAQDDFNRIYDFPFRVIMLPTVFIGQFSEDISEEQIFSALHQLGFNYVIEVDKATGLLMEETKRYMERHPEQRPFISNFCPAVIRLIQVRFPSLIPHIIRLKQAMDITATYVRKKYIDRGIPGEDIGIFYVTQCAAKIAAIKCPVGEEKSSVDGVINMDFIYNKVLLSLKQHRDKPLETVPEQYHLPPQSILWTQSGGEAANYKGRCLAIDEIHNVIDIHLTSVNKMPQYAGYLTEQMQLVGDILPRPIEKLDEDMTVALQKMEKISRMMKVLPQVDCGACGAPSCRVLAQDIVQDKAKLSQCVFLQKVMACEGLLTPEESIELAAETWGSEKFENYE